METQSPTVEKRALPTEISAENGGETDWVQSAIASIGCRKDDSEYLKELFEGAKEARCRIDEEFLRELDERDKK